MSRFQVRPLIKILRASAEAVAAGGIFSRAAGYATRACVQPDTGGVFTRTRPRYDARSPLDPPMFRSLLSRFPRFDSVKRIYL
ncbi:hypothetical protein EVAR_25669_1 [Eumeta japonica]|uniref:Uncharacterized protein n=1 Tax=Eumeta variegata TaxID=151549 RepID=A0A4C1WH47_EUMVA|nr:hypothetical protein EVAR_25669_1 [Eumeta japonica]